MTSPCCQSRASCVDSRPSARGTRRRYSCQSCGKRYSSIETLVQFVREKHDPRPSWKMKAVEADYPVPLKITVKAKVSSLLSRLRAKGIL